jgi:general secretion pathway protein N
MRGSGPAAVFVVLLSGVFASGAARELGPGVAASIGPGALRAIALTSKSPPGEAEANILPTAVRLANAKPVASNPLWAVPIDALSQTVERPLFSPSRRPPPPPVVAAAPVPPAKPLPPPATKPDHPLLTLLGTVVGGSEGIGVFLDETSHDVIRLKTGDVHGGWMLRSVHGRAADFERGDRREATLGLPAPGAEPTAPSLAPAVPVAARAAPGGNDLIVMPPPPSVRPPELSVLPAATKGKFKRTPREL